MQLSSLENSIGQSFGWMIPAVFIALACIAVIAVCIAIVQWRQIRRLQKDRDMSRQETRTLIDTFPAFVNFIDLQHHYLMVNSAYEDLLGYHKQDVVGRHVADILGTASYKVVRPYIETALAGEQTGYEKEIHLPGEEQARIMHARYVPAYDERGRVIGLYGVIMDVTQIKAAQQALKESEERYALAVDGAAIGIWDWNIINNTLFVSNRFSQFAGAYNEIEENTISFEEFETRVHPDDQAYVETALSNHLQDNTPYLVDFRYKRTDGEYIWVQASGQAMWDSAGQAYRMAGSVQDITARKKAEDELRRAKEENELLAQAVAATNVGIIMADATQDDLPLTYINQAFLDITGYTQDEVLGHNCRFLQGPDTASESVEAIRDSLRNGTSQTIEILNYRKNGEPFWNALVISPVFNVKGELIAYVGIQHDISRRKEMEIELEQARAEAERANRAKSEFLAGMSHEIRTPMNGVLGTASLLAETDLDKKQAKYVNVIQDSGRTLLEIINEILEYSKIESGTLELHNASFDLGAELESQLALLQPLAQEKSLDYKIAFSDDLPGHITGDATRLRQVVTNLVGNAIKFTGAEGKVHIALKCDESGSVEFSVTDSGPGIEDDKLDNIFRPFDQVIEHRTQQKTAGTGLGLSISKHLVEMMGGEIGCESTPGEGSRFWFRIPAHAPEEEEVHALQQAREDEHNRDNVQFRADAKVLVAEDVATNQFVIMDMLENFGCQVDLAANGREAVQSAKTVHYDVVLMDCQMPEMDGFEATREIRVLAVQQPVIIALTANALEGDREKCLEAGMNDFIAKPINKRDIAQALKNWLDDSQIKTMGNNAI